MHNQTYSFSEQSRIGKKGEQLLDRWLGTIYQITDVSGIARYQTAGIDRLMVTSDNAVISAEYKFDRAARYTGNIFFESISVDARNLPGWGWASQADYWMFLIPEQEVLVIRPPALRLLVWQERASLKEKRIPNYGYETIGFPVKIETIKCIANEITTLDAPPPIL